MTVPQFRAQLQQQHQETESAATAPVNGQPPPDGAGDDDIISDILGGKADKPERKPRERDTAEGDERQPPEVQEEDEPEEAVPDDDDDAEQDAGDDEGDVEADAGDEPTGDIAAARAAREAGDLDEACRIAFGCKPEDLLPNAHGWTKWRAANDKERKARQRDAEALAVERRNFEQAAHTERVKIHNTIEALKPYEKYYLAEQAYARDGDSAHLVTIIEGISKKAYNEAQKDILTKTRRSPAERAMQERLQQLEAKLSEKDEQTARQTAEQTRQQEYQSDLAYIRQSVSGPVAKIPKFAERIYKILDTTRGPLGLTLTVEQAAERVVKAERKRIASHPFVKQPGKKVPPAASAAGRTLAARAGKGGAPLRRNSQNNGARREGTESTDDIINDILAGKKTGARRSA